MEAGPSGSREEPSTKSDHDDISLPTTIGKNVALHGQKITFACQFNLKEETLYYAVWKVGNIVITRSNEHFQVASLNGLFILCVNKVKSFMEGEVICNVFKHLPPYKSISAHISEGSLTVVAFSFSHKYLHCSSPKKNFNILQMGTTYSIMYKRTTDDELSSNNTTDNVCLAEPNTQLVKIFYCRLDYTEYYFKGDISLKYKDVCVRINDVTPRDDDGNLGELTLRISWAHPIFIDSGVYFKIELQYQNMNKVIGITEEPSLKITNTIVDDLISITITIVKEDQKDTIRDLVIDMHEIEQEYFSVNYKDVRRRIFKDEAAFNKIYIITEHLIGAGIGPTISIAKMRQSLPMENKVFFIKKITQRNTPVTELVTKEFNILQSLQHKNVIFVSSMLYTPSKSYIVMEYLWGNSLYGEFYEKKCSERNLVHYVKQICEALAYLQEENIAHLDLKPENIVLVHPNTRKLKLVEFGVAKYYSNERGWHIRGVVGTRKYVAPEIWTDRLISAASDMWSLGVLMYNLLSVVPPRPKRFLGQRLEERITAKNFRQEIFKQCLTKTPTVETTEPSTSSSNSNNTFNYSNMKDASDVCIDFISRLLMTDHMHRMKARAALNHAWIKYGPPSKTTGAQDQPLKAEVQPHVTFKQSVNKEAANEPVEAGPSSQDAQKPSAKGKGIGKSSKPTDPSKGAKKKVKSLLDKIFKN